MIKKLAIKQVLQLDVNGKLVGTAFVQEDPFAPGEWMLPPNAMDIQPPEDMKDGYDYYYIDGKWEEIKPESIETEQEKVERQLKELQSKENNIAYAKIYRDYLIANATVVIDGMEFDTSNDSLVALAEAVNYNSNNEVDWVLHDNTVATISINTLRKILEQGVAYKNSTWSRVYSDTEHMAEKGRELTTL